MHIEVRSTGGLVGHLLKAAKRLAQHIFVINYRENTGLTIAKLMLIINDEK